MFLSLAVEVLVTVWNPICQTKTEGRVSLSVATVLKRRQKRLDLLAAGPTRSTWTAQ